MLAVKFTSEAVNQFINVATLPGEQYIPLRFRNGFKCLKESKRRSSIWKSHMVLKTGSDWPSNRFNWEPAIKRSDPPRITAQRKTAEKEGTTHWRTLKRRNPSPPSSPPFPGRQRRRRSQVVSAAAVLRSSAPPPSPGRRTLTHRFTGSLTGSVLATLGNIANK
ncbi:hypothetical protein Ahy_A10g050325 isoform A [Arachis hypogaea]|uniref:Uncharacterized protein n=1 Tax=Arachis hypogaea TaxID=3818 RepID=A0A445B948_ARAHY|nr:hypothetical protein Ahy_A10g050325 isoform A [Arachis hypogaea]